MTAPLTRLSLAVLVQLSLVVSAAFHHTPVRGDVSFPSLWRGRSRRFRLASSDHNGSTDVSTSSQSASSESRSRYVTQQLLQDLTHSLDRWIITGSTVPQQRARELLVEIDREGSPDDIAKARRMAKRAGLQFETTTKKELGKTDSQTRRQEAERRSEWEAQRSTSTTGKSVSSRVAGRSALSRRSGDVFMGSVDSNLENTVQSKQDLENALQQSDSSSESTAQVNIDAAVKSAELVALAGRHGFDGETMGIGGLDDVLSEVKRRIWVPLAAPPLLLEELGIHPVRGLLLYGRPGCGKTLLARTIGRILSPTRPITVVSGPELMDKYVGSSEKNLRQVFDNPPPIHNVDEGLAEAALHVIIMDEFDAMARSRGGRSGTGDQGDAGVARDSVVNQLLAKMDGVDPLVVPTLVIGLTNKRSLIDSALLRPGRFEVQIEVPPPRTAAQRVSILKVHTKQMYEAGRLLVQDAPPDTAAARHVETSSLDSSSLLTYDELLGLLAAECEGFTGASLAGVARAAASHALERAVMEFSADPKHHSVGAECLVTQQDFEEAVHDVLERNAESDWEEDEEQEQSTDGDKEENNSDEGDKDETANQ